MASSQYSSRPFRGGGAAGSKTFEGNLDVKPIRLIRGVLGQAQSDHRGVREIYN